MGKVRMKISEKRRRWLSRKTLSNCLSVSAAILVIAAIFEIAQNVIASDLAMIWKSLHILTMWGILTAGLFFYGLLSPELMEVVFRMLGFKEDKNNEEKT